MAQEATEHAKAPAVVRVIELVGVSNKSWSDAAQQAVTRASETILGRSRFLWTLDKKELTSDRDDDDDAASG